MAQSAAIPVATQSVVFWAWFPLTTRGGCPFLPRTDGPPVFRVQAATTFAHGMLRSASIRTDVSARTDGVASTATKTSTNV